MPKRYNTPHRSRVVKTRLSEEEYADILKKFITSLEGKVKAQKKSGLDEALEDVKAGRIYHAESTKDLMKQILG